jgi:ferredoxin
VDEVEQAEEEGIRFSFLTVPIEVMGENGHMTGLKCLRAELVKMDGSDRMHPRPVEGSDFIMDVDAVIVAIGQRVDVDCMSDGLCDLKWTRRDTFDVNNVSMETSKPGVFAGGDAVTGPATVVEAIGAGKRAAEAIDRYLSGIPQPKMPPVPVRRGRVEQLIVPASTKMALRRPEMPLLNIDRRRVTFQQVELGYSENQVREEARRCLRCDVCMRCGKCVEICRDKMGVNALQFGHLEFDHPVPTDFRRSEDICILCGACAANCPNDAMQIEDINGERVLSFCGTILNRQKLHYCKECGAVLGPAKYLDFVRGRTRSVTKLIFDRDLCENCVRKKEAVKLQMEGAVPGGPGNRPTSR